MLSVKEIYAVRKIIGERIQIDLINFREGLLLSDWEWISLNEVELLAEK